ncbi:hypothetical protein FACS1894105_09830 [Clostridia bacterium]|nr:hypothetical protein FACS1894105_09830 [Clostridia bacterium]
MLAYYELKGVQTYGYIIHYFGSNVNMLYANFVELAYKAYLSRVHIQQHTLDTSQ